MTGKDPISSSYIYRETTVSSIPTYMTSKLGHETFTIWMKSLLFHTYGCTVFNSKGEIVYRVDNYGSKCSREIHLMDLRGKVLFTICRKVTYNYIHNENIMNTTMILD